MDDSTLCLLVDTVTQDYSLKKEKDIKKRQLQTLLDISDSMLKEQHNYSQPTLNSHNRSKTDQQQTSSFNQEPPQTMHNNYQHPVVYNQNYPHQQPPQLPPPHQHQQQQQQQHQQPMYGASLSLDPYPVRYYHPMQTYVQNKAPYSDKINDTSAITHEDLKSVSKVVSLLKREYQNSAETNDKQLPVKQLKPESPIEDVKNIDSGAGASNKDPLLLTINNSIKQWKNMTNNGEHNAIPTPEDISSFIKNIGNLKNGIELTKASVKSKHCPGPSKYNRAEFNNLLAFGKSEY